MQHANRASSPLIRELRVAKIVARPNSQIQLGRWNVKIAQQGNHRIKLGRPNVKTAPPAIILMHTPNTVAMNVTQGCTRQLQEQRVAKTVLQADTKIPKVRASAKAALKANTSTQKGRPTRLLACRAIEKKRKTGSLHWT